MICEICGKDFNGAAHINKKHNINIKEYYDKYIKQQNEGICPICGKPTTFRGLKIGYTKYCSVKCSQNDPVVREKVSTTYKKTMLDKYGVENPQQIQYVKEKTKQTCLERYGSEYAIASKPIKYKISNTQKSKLKHYNGLIKTDVLIKKYGSGWYLVRKKLNIKIIMKGRYSYIDENDIAKIEQYIHSNFSHSKKEEYLVKSIKSYYHDECIQNTKLIIKPYQLDIWLPKLKIAIEYNSNWYHSIEQGRHKYYHLQKSLLCRDKCIRLIHIYEFEDFEEQKQLLKDLILGTDNYPKDDFNKNNLIDNIPDPEVIYKNNVTIYGAGKLY